MVTLLERLHMKWLVSTSLVTEETHVPNSHSRLKSSMDFSPTPLDPAATVPPSLIKKIVKTGCDIRKPHSSSTRAYLRNFPSERKQGVMVKRPFLYKV
ncbi:unnamed protein product [Lactuca virosa]|uniref:Uncharacterized protein n=1 Tax=Lactuca virosa TaxID=75947 RepID=A0AAU9MAR0_9ASTR|nr:unnamed protein product [Lactuca virosa]